MHVNCASADRRFGFLIGDVSRLAAHMEREGWIGRRDGPRDGRACGVFRRARTPKLLAQLNHRVATMRQETFAGLPASSHEVRFDDLQPIERPLLTPGSRAQRQSSP